MSQESSWRAVVVGLMDRKKHWRYRVHASRGCIARFIAAFETGNLRAPGTSVGRAPTDPGWS